MMDLVASIRTNKMLLVPAVALAVVLVMNARTGYMLTGGSLAFAAVFVAVGVATARAAAVAFSMPDWSPRKVAMIGWLIVGLAADQYCGWMTAGVMFGDGAAARQTQSDNLNTLREQLTAKRDERKALGTPRAIDAIKAELQLECSITSPRYKDGVGPRCTKLKSDLAGAERAAKLDAEIGPLMTQIEGRRQVAAGHAEYTVPLRLSAMVGAGLGPDDIRFWVEMMLIAILGFLANIGWWLFDDRRPASAPAGGSSSGGSSPDDWGPRLLTGPDRHADTAPHSSAPALSSWSRPAPATAPVPLVPAPSAGVAAPLDPDRRVPAPAVVAALPGPSTAAAAAPVDRGAVNASLDKLLTFKAARLEPCAPDARPLPLSWAYREYMSWARGRGVSGAAFRELMVASGSTLASLNGVEHLVGVQLRQDATAAMGA